MMSVLFWIILTVLLYCYFGYPLVLWIISQKNRRSVDKKEIIPFVSIVVSVWNEEDVIDAKIKNLLEVDYPNGKIEILVGSDGSDDKTNEILGSYQQQIKTFFYPQRRGKMAVLNGLLAAAKGEIIVFTDARQQFDAKAVKELIANFHDKDVGCVSGELILSREEGGTAKGVGLYWKYEKFLRAKESDIHSMLGATGAIYAIRKNLFHPIPQEIVLDDVYVPLTIISKGFRAIFDSEAKAFDRVATTPQEENRRKIRTLFGNCQMFHLFKPLFNFRKSPIAWQLLSHKYLRILGPFLMVLLFVVNGILCLYSSYQGFFVLQILFYLLAFMGFLTRTQSKGFLKLLSSICYVPYVFCLLNYSAFVGVFRYFFVPHDVKWQKARRGK